MSYVTALHLVPNSSRFEINTVPTYCGMDKGVAMTKARGTLFDTATYHELLHHYYGNLLWKGTQTVLFLFCS
jgi:hypothetical protein